MALWKISLIFSLFSIAGIVGGVVFFIFFLKKYGEGLRGIWLLLVCLFGLCLALIIAALFCRLGLTVVKQFLPTAPAAHEPEPDTPIPELPPQHSALCLHPERSHDEISTRRGNS